MKSQHSEQPTFVILGASGDLTYRLLMPAIFRLFLAGKWESPILGYAPDDWNPERFLKRIEEGLREFVHEFDAQKWNQFK